MWGALQNAAKIASAAVENSDQLLGNLTNQATRLLENLDREYDGENDENAEANASDNDEAADITQDEVVRPAVSIGIMPEEEKDIPVKKSPKHVDAWDDIDNLLDEANENDEELASLAVPHHEQESMVQESHAKPVAVPVTVSSSTAAHVVNTDKNDAVISALRLQVEELQTQNSALKASMNESSLILDQLQGDLYNAQNENSRLQTVITEHESTMQSLKESQQAAESLQQRQMKEWKRILVEMQQDKDNAVNELDSLRTQLGSKQEEIQALHMQMEALAVKHQQDQQISSLRQKLDDVKMIRVS
jgi:hypothetical protein